LAQQFYREPGTNKFRKGFSHLYNSSSFLFYFWAYCCSNGFRVGLVIGQNYSNWYEVNSVPYHAGYHTRACYSERPSPSLLPVSIPRVWCWVIFRTQLFRFGLVVTLRGKPLLSVICSVSGEGDIYIYIYIYKLISIF
jgi:hypothetical protein